MTALYPLLKRQDAALDLRRTQIVAELEVEGGHDLLGRKMHREYTACLLDARLAQRQGHNGVPNPFARPLPNQQLLAFTRDQDGRDRKHKADQDGGDAVDLRHIPGVGRKKRLRQR